MKRELDILRSLEKHEGYKYLMALWMQEITEIEIKRDAAASRGQESAWRYFAGQEKGAKRMITRLSEELIRMEDEGGDVLDQPTKMVEDLMAYARGEKK